MQPRHKLARAFPALLVTLVLLAATAPASRAAPSCAEGPQTVGNTIFGTPCADTIRAPRSVTIVNGEGGDDVLYGQRGNDQLDGGEGNDRIYGGIGDDRPRGGPGNDLLSGGFGADSLDGEGGDDFVRGDATVDSIRDSGGGTDTLSFATGTTPGFPNEGSVVAYANFPPSDGERGVYVELSGNFANNGLAPDGGGVDKPLEAANFESFETVVGTPFSDVIVGSSAAETFYGGGGADVILGKGGADQILGGADGDYCEAGGSASSCEFSGSNKSVAPRDSAAVATGLMTLGGPGPAGIYLAGGEGADNVSATYATAPARVTFELLPGSASTFDASAAAAGGCDAPASGKVVCPVTTALDSVVLAGLDGDDAITASGFPATTSVILLGGGGEDALTGGETEDALVDGPGDDSASAAGGDDAVPNNEGLDTLDAGAGEDLFISDSICEGDTLDGGADRDNANWANFDFAIAIDMVGKVAGLAGATGQPECSGDPLTELEAIEDVEGTDGDDTLVGDSGPNQLLGRPGNDSYLAAAGNDTILANSADSDPVIECGEGFDTALIDIPSGTYQDATPVDCEDVEERIPNSFRPPNTPTEPNAGLPPETTSPPQPSAKKPPLRPKDRVPPHTRLLRRPAKILFSSGSRRAVAFAFTANEVGATFRCKLDGKPFRPCRSPRFYRLRPGPHAFRAFAIDRAGNRDRTPALVKLRIRRR